MIGLGFGPLALAAASAWGGDAPASWPRFRGPEGAGVAAAGKPLPVALDPDTHLAWSTAVPAGESSPIVWGERVFLTGHADGQLLVLALDRASGELLWQREHAVERIESSHELHGPASSTPTTDGERVVAYFGSLGLVAYDLEGEPLWERALPLPDNTFGSAASPVFVGERLILQHDTNGPSWVECVDPASGERIWRTERADFGSSWSTPVAWRNGAVEELLVYGVGWLTAYDLATGHQRWAIPGLSDEPIVTPSVGGGLIYLSSYNMRTNPEVVGIPAWEELLEAHDADGNGTLDRDEAATNDSVLSRHDADGEGDHPLRIFFRWLDGNRDGELDEEEFARLQAWVDTFAHANGVIAVRPGADEREPVIAWQHPRGVPECPSPLYYEGRLYAVKNGGIASSFDAATGALHWQGRIDSRGPHYASPVAGDGKLYVASARGRLTVLGTGDELEILSAHELGERVMATPALVDGQVLVRGAEQLYAFESVDER